MNEGTRLFPEDTEPHSIRLREPKHTKRTVIALAVTAALVCGAGFVAYSYRAELGSAFSGLFENININMPSFSFDGIFGGSQSSSESENSSEISETSSEPSESTSSISSSESESVPEIISVPEPEPVVEPDPIPRDEWYMLLVNKEHPVSQDFTVKTRAVDSAGHLLDERVYDDFTAMIAAGKAEGLNFSVYTAYRTYEKQSSLYRTEYEKLITAGYSDADAQKEASSSAAKPGTSEHNSGLAVDIASTYGDFEGSSEQSWLLEHAYEYGFILRYPEGKEAVTGFSYEPWHYRYVGKEQAKLIYESGLCLEEYLEEK